MLEPPESFFTLVRNTSKFLLMASSRPYASVTPGDSNTEEARVPIVRPITARVIRIIPSNDREYVDVVLYSQNPRGRPSHLMASAIHSCSSERLVRALIRGLWLPGDVTLLVPRISDTVCNPPLDYFSVYVEHIRAGLCFPLLPLIVELLGSLTQLVLNTIRVILGFENCVG